jgi:molybdopterin molybdotransferase
MIELSEAYPILWANIRPLPVVDIALGDALFRTLADPVVTDIDDPPFDRSVMDGYAVRSTDVAAAPVRLRVVGTVSAGQMATDTLRSGEAMLINTGAPIPPGADAVVRVEDTETCDDAMVTVRARVSPGEFITRRGVNISAGSIVLPAKTVLTPAAIGAAAAAGAAIVSVYRRPKVAVLATGDELVAIDRLPADGQIRNSNESLLSALIESVRATSAALGVAPDNRGKLRRRIREGLTYDILCLTGGVSMGVKDLVPEVLIELGATFHIRKISIKPGRPVIFATMPDGTLVFALPGNPASAFVGFELLVRPALAALEGRPGALPWPHGATLVGTLSATQARRSYLPARARVDDNGKWFVEPLSWKGSGDVFGLALADSLIERPPHAPAASSGEMVSVLRLAQN